MNKLFLIGRLTRDPEIHYSQGANAMAIANFTLAVDRKGVKKDPANPDQVTADFLRCVTFGKQAEFVEKYLHQGIKMAIVGRIQTGSYVNKDGQKVYTTDIVVEEMEFAESKAASQGNSTQKPVPQPSTADASFMNVDGAINEELPFV